MLAATFDYNPAISRKCHFTPEPRNFQKMSFCTRISELANITFSRKCHFVPESQNWQISCFPENVILYQNLRIGKYHIFQKISFCTRISELANIMFSRKCHFVPESQNQQISRFPESVILYQNLRIGKYHVFQKMSFCTRISESANITFSRKCHFVPESQNWQILHFPENVILYQNLRIGKYHVFQKMSFCTKISELANIMFSRKCHFVPESQNQQISRFPESVILYQNLRIGKYHVFQKMSFCTRISESANITFSRKCHFVPESQNWQILHFPENVILYQNLRIGKYHVFQKMSFCTRISESANITFSRKCHFVPESQNQQISHFPESVILYQNLRISKYHIFQKVSFCTRISESANITFSRKCHFVPESQNWQISRFPENVTLYQNLRIGKYHVFQKMSFCTRISKLANITFSGKCHFIPESQNRQYQVFGKMPFCPRTTTLLPLFSHLEESYLYLLICSNQRFS